MLQSMLMLLLSHFSRVRLCDPIDGSPPGSPVPGILQARTLEWVAISFSNAGKWKAKVKSLSLVQLFSTPWTAAYQAPHIHGIFQARVLESGAIAFSRNVPLVSLIFLKRSLVFPILLFSSICLLWSPWKTFLCLLSILWNSAFRCLYLSFSSLLFTSLLFTGIVRPPQTAILLFCISFPRGWSWSLSPVQCHEPLSIVHQALMLKLKLQYFGHLMRKVDSLEKTLMLGEIGGRRRGWGLGTTEDEMAGWHHQLDEH